MAKTDNLTDFLTSVADAIRAKKGTSDLINPQNFDSEIAGISTSKEEQEKTVTITENGAVTVEPDSGKALSKVTVTTNVPANVATKTITVNGTYNATDDGVDGYSTVEVDVAGSGGAELNIAYGETAPTDTSKLWIKSATPANVKISPVLSGSEYLNNFIATLPTAAWGMGCAAVGTKIYLFGGIDSSNVRLNTINVFNTTTNAITTLSTTLPKAACLIGCASVGTKIYLFGGIDNNNKELNTINVFDTTTNAIAKSSTTLPKAAQGISCVAVGTKIYLLGGYGSSKYDTIRVFDTTANTITTLSATLPTAAYGMGCAAVGTKIYLFGGIGSSSLNTINVFDTTTNTITTLSTTLPKATYYIACASFGTKIYLFGATGNKILAFDTTTDIITELSTTLPSSTSGLSCALIDTKIYLFGGSGLNTINEFVVSAALSSGNIQIVQNMKDLFKIISSETTICEIGIDKVYKGNSDNIAELCDAYLHDGTNWINVNTGEVYVKADALAGTWVLNDTITFSSSSSGLPNINSFNFTSNNTSFYGFYFDVNSDGDNSLDYRTNQEYAGLSIYDYRGNIISGKEAYKTITITSKLSEVTNGDKLLTWLQANATKQS